MYKPGRNGFTFVSGRLVRIRRGEICEEDLAHLSHAVPVAVEGKPLDGTVKEIKRWLDQNGVEYPPGARKSELIELLKEA